MINIYSNELYKNFSQFLDEFQAVLDKNKVCSSSYGLKIRIFKFNET